MAWPVGEKLVCDSWMGRGPHGFVAAQAAFLLFLLNRDDRHSNTWLEQEIYFLLGISCSLLYKKSELLDLHPWFSSRAPKLELCELLLALLLYFIYLSTKYPVWLDSVLSNLKQASTQSLGLSKKEANNVRKIQNLIYT